ncbi:hypothetical protein PAHAL_5G350700 [Panicum hallii]|uniref:Uncharacterized protein n=1 Tax=Panicum hallii TaxID=206008 RepID=A0A2T8IMA2_9POAL|nr:hypothetical protein PAHAL_5G350700 [Panicum hallii]
MTSPIIFGPSFRKETSQVHTVLSFCHLLLELRCAMLSSLLKVLLIGTSLIIIIGS